MSRRTVSFRDGNCVWGRYQHYSIFDEASEGADAEGSFGSSIQVSPWSKLQCRGFLRFFWPAWTPWKEKNSPRVKKSMGRTLAFSISSRSLARGSLKETKDSANQQTNNPQIRFVWPHCICSPMNSKRFRADHFMNLNGFFGIYVLTLHEPPWQVTSNWNYGQIEPPKVCANLFKFLVTESSVYVVYICEQNWTTLPPA